MPGVRLTLHERWPGRSHLVEAGGVGGTPGVELQPSIAEVIRLKQKAPKGKLRKKISPQILKRVKCPKSWWEEL